MTMKTEYRYAVVRDGEHLATISADSYATAYAILATMYPDNDATDLDTIDENAADITADDDSENTDSATRYRVHLIPDSDYTLLLVPVQIARNSIKRTVSRAGGTATERTIYYDLTGLLIDTYRQAEPATEWLFDRIADIGADAAEYIGLASKGLVDAMASGDSISEQYRAAYISINKWVRSQRGQTDNEKSLEYITTGGGDVVTVNQYIGRILSGKDTYYPADSYGTMDAETAAHLGATLSAAFRLLTPRQLDIVRLTAKGYSTRGVAEQLRLKSDGTVKTHLAIIRGKIADYIEQNAPEFTPFIRDAEIQAARQARNSDRHAKGGAAYMREYRARKKAERENND